MAPNVIIGYILLGLFVVMSGIHLKFCFDEDEKHRRVTKCFCVLLLAISAICFMPTRPLIYCGAFLGIIGDFFLINKHHKASFIAGTIFFIGGHFCYGAEALLCLHNVGIDFPYYIYIIICGFLFVCIFALYPFSKQIAGKIALFGNFYMPLLLCLLALGIYCSIVMPSLLGGLLFALGYFFFFTSDTILTLTTFKKNIKRRDFFIMLTYLLAQVCIVLGLLALGGFAWH